MAMGMKTSAVAEKLFRDFGRLQSLRGNFESHWKEIAERILPDDSFLFEAGGNQISKGEKRTRELYDATAMVALGRFAAILDSLLTPRNQLWHKLKTNNKILQRNRSVQLWLDDVVAVLFNYRYAPDSNFSSQNLMSWSSLGAYGTGSLFIDDLATGKGIRYKNNHLSEIFFRENHQGLINRAERYFTLTAIQAYDQWKRGCPESLLSCLETDPDREFKFLHCVKPREDYDPKKIDSQNMPFASYYASEEDKILLSEGGYRTFPYSISRYTQVTGEVYGRSPAMRVLPAIKTLNEQKKTVLKSAHRVSDPVYITHDDGVLDTFSARPGSINAGGVTADGRPLIHALPSGDPRIGKDMMDDERSLINDEFLITLFQILVETPQMTATEVMERTREKGILLAPTVGRQQSEYLGPLINREIDVLESQGLIPPPPPILLQAAGEFEYEVEYDSPLSRIQKSEGTSGFLRTMEFALNYATVAQDPSVLDYFELDEAIPEIALTYGTPVRFLKSMEKILQIREGRAQQQQMQTAIQAAPGLAAVTKANAVADKG